MYENLLKTVTGLGSPKVLVVGDFMLDIYIYGDALRISPEAPVPVLKVHKTEYSCGGAASVAADLADLGAAPVCVGIIGDDGNGKILEQKLTEFKADISGLLKVNDRPTISKQRLIGLAQHRHQQQLFRMDEESTGPLSEEQYDKILRTFEERLPQADIVCLQDHDKGLLTKSLCSVMIKLSRQANTKVIIDPCLNGDYSKYLGATVITPNRQETSAAVGFEIKTPKDFAKAAKELAEKLKLEAVVITLDKLGAYLKAEEERMIPTQARDVYDVTGAGDMVLSTLAMTLADNCDYQTAVQLANITGGIEVGKFGNKTVTRKEIINEILKQRQDTSSKIYSLEPLLDELSRDRKAKKSIVFTNGCFDVIHRGHIKYLEFCKSQGDIVVVGLNSDSSVKIIKGPERPINNQDDRGVVLAALEMVDYITVFDEADPLNLIKKLKPNVLVKGRDWAEKGVVGREFVESCGGKVVLAQLVEGKSTTATIEKMKALETES